MNGHIEKSGLFRIEKAFFSRIKRKKNNAMCSSDIKDKYNSNRRVRGGVKGRKEKAVLRKQIDSKDQLKI